MPQAEWWGRLQSWPVGFEDHVGHPRRGPWCAVGETGLGVLVGILAWRWRVGRLSSLVSSSKNVEACLVLPKSMEDTLVRSLGVCHPLAAWRGGSREVVKTGQSLPVPFVEHHLCINLSCYAAASLPVRMGIPTLQKRKLRFRRVQLKLTGANLEDTRT